MEPEPLVVSPEPGLPLPDPESPLRSLGLPSVDREPVSLAAPVPGVPLALDLPVLLFFLSGSLMISQTLRMPKR